MHQKWQYWNTRARKWLWVVVVIGLVAAIPVISDRLQTEATSRTVEIVFDYRDLTDAASYQAHPQDYLNEQLDRLKEAGVTSMALFESTLGELEKARRIVTYNEKDVSRLTGQPVPGNQNFTYVQFSNKESADAFAPMIKETFASLGIAVNPWSYEGQSGLVIETSPEDASLKPMQPDPIAMAMLRSKGFNIMPRMTDSLPYNQHLVESTLSTFEQNGVKRILFEGESVKGFHDDAEMNSVTAFAELLNKHGIGVAAIEGLKAPQLGFNRLAYLIDYNVVRLHSLSEGDSTLDIQTISDRFVLATKDRNIRILYLNTIPTRSVVEAKVKDSVDNLIQALAAPGNAVQRIESNGFTIGQAEPFQVSDSSMQRYFKMVAVAGAVALIAIMISYFIPALTLAAFGLGIIGCAGLYVLNASLMEQALALAAAISAPTVATVLAIRKVSALHEQNPGLSAGSRLAKSVLLFVQTSILSLAAVPFVIALLNNISYSLVLNQFRGVSLLHFAPIFLVAVYLFFYRGISLKTEIPKLLRMPVTVLMVGAAVILAGAGYYYLSRTGNAGSVSSYEMAFRTFLENTFGVRPRNKEFLMAHPLFIVGIFAALKHRKAIYVLIIAVIGQLSMVDTFAHIHSPIVISLIRGLLGLGMGLLIGIIAVAVWQLLEGCWNKWSPRLRKL
ncbi:DUF5693 family protein [Paenibacillus sp. P96]|uniref:DUF5693 family protein n=1 Tax=Paenibacillus zeirhizosphaerae TaxID=2987519 RepID=A0ABT9FMW1_9BACL|nr:DUF5693 family protein [Paenibacillus sp. P96]MDP4096076.1 DUF5693 family protein [Paenibacillus sp. P96]